MGYEYCTYSFLPPPNFCSISIVDNPSSVQRAPYPAKHEVVALGHEPVVHAQHDNPGVPLAHSSNARRHWLRGDEEYLQYERRGRGEGEGKTGEYRWVHVLRLAACPSFVHVRSLRWTSAVYFFLLNPPLISLSQARRTRQTESGSGENIPVETAC